MSLDTKIKNLELDLFSMGELVFKTLAEAVKALETRDVELAEVVKKKDGEVDKAYLKIDKDWFELMATEQPVAKDLRLATSILQAS